MELMSKYYLKMFLESYVFFSAFGEYFVVVVAFLGLHQWNMEVPRLEGKSELQLLACTTVTARQDLNRICDLHNSSQE